MAKKFSPSDVEFVSNDKHFKRFDEAIADAAMRSLYMGKYTSSKVIYHSEEAARHFGGSEAANLYLSNPNQEVGEMFSLIVKPQGLLVGDSFVS